MNFIDHLADEGIRPSIGSVADTSGNGLMECVIGLYKSAPRSSTASFTRPSATLGRLGV
ncbi:hypothetical protein [Rhodococcus sp. ACPA1]|uniref:hypothetical protein n=1 Tax=Rhodococcus sp. ACPA1 TaxID=2028572 RepID=UPI0015C926FF|nr:hypothetical protein [Rhodococcus sp. ACPA1]